MPRRLLQYLLFTLLCANAVVTLAGDPTGTWSSSTGSTIRIWANMDQIRVTVTTAQGQSQTQEGWWTRFSDYFSYNGSGGTYNASFNGNNEIRVQTPTGDVSVWRRMGQTATPAQRPVAKQVNIAGLWRSTSGSSVQISSQGKQVFVTLVNNKGNRLNGSGRWLSNASFDYSIPGYPGVANCNILSNDQISVVYNNESNTWYRQ